MGIHYNFKSFLQEYPKPCFKYQWLEPRDWSADQNAYGYADQPYSFASTSRSVLIQSIPDLVPWRS